MMYQPPPPAPVPLLRRIWDRHRWLIIGALLFLLMDLVLLLALGTSPRGNRL